MNPLLPAGAQRGLVLASGSPRRSDILRGLNFEFEVIPPAENLESQASVVDPLERPVACARLKAQDVAARRPEELVIGADTVVMLDGGILEKPRDDAEARRFLISLSGREHTVVTGVALRRNSTGLDISGSEQTQVRFRELAEPEIERYVECGEGRDKAGSYAVQGVGAGLVRSIDGCFYNVVGLPVALLFDLLRRAHS